ncbi:MAG: hypothetical protein D4Q79_00880 [Spirochaetia bacterium]|nr:MAG: hypothetical protein D4Q79_00880 [Spirochaetia bacterium]
MVNDVNKKPKRELSVILPLIKNYPSRKEWEVVCWRKILESKELLNLLITSNEGHNLVMRAVVMEGLFSGKSYKQISEELWLSPQTISSIKKALKEKAYRSYRERGKTERKKKVYSSWSRPAPKRSRPKGVPRRTKYGTVYFPQI